MMEVTTYGYYTGKETVTSLESAIEQKIRSDPYERGETADEALHRVNQLVPILTGMIELLVEKRIITQEEVCEKLLGYGFKPYTGT